MKAMLVTIFVRWRKKSLLDPFDLCNTDCVSDAYNGKKTIGDKNDQHRHQNLKIIRSTYTIFISEGSKIALSR